jgi:hypothetical protein
MALYLQPVSYADACLFVTQYHRHHRPPQGWKWGIAVNDGERVVGVVMVGRPVARYLDDGRTLEVTRCCTDGTKNATSKLYGAAWRASKAMGYQRLVTYILSTESGTSLLASGWKCLYETRGGSWSCKSRPRTDRHPLSAKTYWQIDTPGVSCQVPTRIAGTEPASMRFDFDSLGSAN